MAKSKINYLSFKDAREFARKLNLKNNQEWRAWCKSEARPPNIISTPERRYKEDWNGWGDWLGTENISNNKNQEKINLKMFFHQKVMSNIRNLSRSILTSYLKINITFD